VFLVAVGKVNGYVFKEAVVQLDKQAEKEAHLDGVERCGGVFEDAFEGGKTCFAQFFAARLKVPISVCAPEKSIVPCACAAPVNASRRRLGAMTRMAWRKRLLSDWAA